jgi:signal transduction histidine kinase
MGSSGGGVGRIDDAYAQRPRFVRYTTADGLASDHITSITGDRAGRIYIGMFSGIDRLDPTTGHVRHYALPDALADSEVDVAFCDRRGTLWFGTVRGLASLIPPPDAPGTPPTIFIGGLRVSGRAYPVSELGDTAIPAIALDPHQNTLQIDFFSISTVSPVRYQYKLEGADRAWSDPTEQTSVTFASLSPGRYRFLVRAISADGLTSAAPASVVFHISSPVWQRWWFLMLAASVVAAAAYGLHRVRLARLLEIERVRTRIAIDLHDDIGSSLTQIAILSEVAERRMKEPDPAVAEPISRVSLISRELVDSMSEIVWAINPRNDRLRDLAARMRRFAADMLTSRKIALRFRSRDDEQDVPIDAELRRQVFLIFKEAVHNAVRHSGCTEVEVEIGVRNRRLVLRVADNGRGFDAGETADGHGVTSMRARARDMRGSLEIRSAPVHGTTVRVDVPLTRRATGARKAS